MMPLPVQTEKFKPQSVTIPNLVARARLLISSREAMLQVQRDAIVADVTAQTQHLIARELDALLNFMNSLAITSGVLGGFSLWVYETPMSDKSIGGTGDTMPKPYAVLYYVFSCISLCSYIVVCVTASLVSAQASTFGMTSDSPQAVRDAVLMVRQDRTLVLFAFGAGVAFMLAALAVEYASDALLTETVINLCVILSTLIIIAIIFWRTFKRYRYLPKEHAAVSGDAFLKMGGSLPTEATPFNK